MLDALDFLHKNSHQENHNRETNIFSCVSPALLNHIKFSQNIPEASLDYLYHYKLSFSFYTKTQVITEIFLTNEIAKFFDY